MFETIKKAYSSFRGEDYRRQLDDERAKSARLVQQLRYALNPSRPGSWANDHRSETEKFTSWNYVAIRAKALQCAMAKVKVYQDSSGNYALEGEEKQPLRADHPLVRLYRRPNPQQSGASFRYEQVVQLELTGTCLIWRVRNGLGLTVERYVIPTAAAVPMQPTPDMPKGGWYIQPHHSSVSFDEDGFIETHGYYAALGAKIAYEDMLVIRWPHPLYKDDGYSSLSAGAVWNDTSEQIDEARHSHLQNGPDPSILVSPPADVKDLDEAELRRAEARFNEKYVGSGNAGKAMFAEAGTVQILSNVPKDMGYTESFDQFRDATLALHGVPPVAAGITEGGSYAAFYASLKQMSTTTMGPLCALLSEEETEQQAPEFGKGLIVEIEPPSFDDPDLQERRIQTQLLAGTATVDEIRSEYGRPPWGGSEGARIAGSLGAASPPVKRDASGGETPFTTGVTGMAPPRPGAAAGVDLSSSDFPMDEAPPAEFMEGSRRDFQKWMRNTQDILQKFRDGEVNEVFALQMLEAFGLSQARAETLIEEEKRSMATHNGNGSMNGNGKSRWRGKSRFKSDLLPRKNYEYGSIMAFLPLDAANAVRAYGKSIDPDDLARIDFPLEDEPHLTILYGILPDVPPEDIDRLANRIEPFSVHFGDTDYFRNDEDILHFRVESPEAVDFNRMARSTVKAIPNEHPSFVPHITVARLTPGMGKIYAEDDMFVGSSFKVDTVHYANADGDRFAIRLGGTYGKKKIRRGRGDNWLRSAGVAAGLNGSNFGE